MSHIPNQNVSVTKLASLYTIYISTQVSEKQKFNILFAEKVNISIPWNV